MTYIYINLDGNKSLHQQQFEANSPLTPSIDDVVELDGIQYQVKILVKSPKELSIKAYIKEKPAPNGEVRVTNMVRSQKTDLL